MPVLPLNLYINPCICPSYWSQQAPTRLEPKAPGLPLELAGSHEAGAREASRLPRDRSQGLGLPLELAGSHEAGAKGPADFHETEVKRHSRWLPPSCLVCACLNKCLNAWLQNIHSRLLAFVLVTGLGVRDSWRSRQDPRRTQFQLQPQLGGSRRTNTRIGECHKWDGSEWGYKDIWKWNLKKGSVI